MFHRNDPKQIKAHYGGLEAVQKPDIIFLRRQDIVGSENGEPLIPMQAPSRSFDWHIPKSDDGEGEEEGEDEKRGEEGEDEKYLGASKPPDSPGSAMLGSKRPWLGTYGTSSKRMKHEQLADAALVGRIHIPPSPFVQKAIYAAEILNRDVYALHACSILIIDDVAWIWCFDRLSTIQTTGINFLQDLPYSSALLFTFQRLTRLNRWTIRMPFASPESNDDEVSNR
ncbi:hypothetical protein K443DRAFT_295185 [Laccaria amethystina LaAM-08-1]|uniref:Fungal-type protein kinase domain-containing protein n=1 Tax=Laccaria amethystina LaAM-08-1 TaxID=1095629 RepID=A0A0C9X4A6_9AGAR|nr:hypothetical protein K443DRAFT_295185 [Laccaria amethystina LaAM-08-1]